MSGVVQSSGRLPGLQWAAVSLPLPGETVSGDLFLVHAIPNGVLLGVVDALGHGPEAAVAARTAVAAMDRHAESPIIPLFQQSHEALAGTRGVVAALAAINVKESTLTWAAVGNIEGVLVRSKPGSRRVSIMQIGGVVGYKLPRLSDSESIRLARGDRLVFATDGIREGFTEALNTIDSPARLAETVIQRYIKGTDDALVLVAQYGGEET
ncbi:MAG TPA: SpoIIE family protein phosphatase [Planctomycetota bacterium]|jgi:serine phosphatase RsbU (regulator of sigma subunit)